MKERPLQDQRLLEAYTADLRRTQPLNRQQEQGLFERVQQGDDKALRAVVTANLRFVLDVAYEYEGRGLPLPDLIGAGNAGLLEAAQRFEPQRGWKFITYAVWWIRQRILHALAEEGRTVRLPVSAQTLLRRIRESRVRYYNIHGFYPSDAALYEELATYTQRPQRPDWPRFLALLHQQEGCVSLDAPFNGNDQTSLINALPDSKIPPPPHQTEAHHQTEQIATALKRLPSRDARVLQLLYGLNGERPHTLEEVGQIMSLTRERIRQIRNRALDTLKAHAPEVGLSPRQVEETHR